MKKLTLITAIVGLATLSYAQGYVNFVNGTATTFAQTNNILNIYGAANGGSAQGDTSAHSTGDIYYYALLMLPYSGGASNSATASTFTGEDWLFTGLYGTNALSKGSISGTASIASLANDAAGSGNQFVIVGWSASLAGGNGWLTISNDLADQFAGNSTAGYLGISMTGTGTGAGNPPAIAENLFGLAGSTAITSPITLYAVPVPEPATMALAGLSGLALVLFRRRK